MKVKTHISFNEKGVFVNGELQSFDLTNDGEGRSTFTGLYKALQLSYPKFYKMDGLCKLGFLGVELLKREVDLASYNEDEVALVFENRSSSLDTDVKHQEKINQEGEQPSPAIFVYTLPNIVIGEIAIRNSWFGENLFILSEKFHLEKWLERCELLFNSKKANVAIGGWVEVFEGQFDLQLYLIEKE